MEARPRCSAVWIEAGELHAWSACKTSVVVDRQFSEPRLAALYDAFCPWERFGDYDFYLILVMSAEAVLDVGCGTGALLRRAREDGHTGRLCGLDPAVGMLDQARTRSDIEWILGDLSSTAWDREFDLVVMSGHAFQVFVDDDDVRASLAAIGRRSPTKAASHSRLATHWLGRGKTGPRRTQPR